MHHRSADLAACFERKDQLIYCNDIVRLFYTMNQEFIPNEWRLFIDGNKTSLKVVMLHNGNEKPSIPIAYAVGVKEQYSVMKDIIQCIQYHRFKFQIVADFKVIGILMGLQSGYTTHCCYLCLWNSRDRAQHYVRNKWPDREEYTPGIENVKYEPLVDADSIIPPPLHIKLGLFKNFVKALDPNQSAFKYLTELFPQLSKGIKNVRVYYCCSIVHICSIHICYTKIAISIMNYCLTPNHRNSKFHFAVISHPSHKISIANPTNFTGRPCIILVHMQFEISKIGLSNGIGCGFLVTACRKKTTNITEYIW